MRILVHDYAGHPFPIELSRALAHRGHEVLHVYSASNNNPQGSLARKEDDAEGYLPTPITLKQPIEKGALLKRRRQEVEHGRKVVKKLEEFRPEVVLSGNTPLDPQRLIQVASRRTGAKFVYWVQDLVGVATRLLLRDRMRLAGDAIGGYYERLEQRLLRNSDALVLITEDFKGYVPHDKVERTEVIPNWGPIADLPVKPRENSWREEMGLGDRPVALYSGTLGLKHNPRLLLELAKNLQDTEAVVVVVGVGTGADFLHESPEARRLENLKLLGFQDYERVPEVLGSADVLVALLEENASVFSVPSKVLAYLCAERPILLAVPKSNMAAKLVNSLNAGEVVEPRATEAFVQAARQMLFSRDKAEQQGKAARAYAEENFRVDAIATRFEDLFGSLVKRP